MVYSWISLLYGGCLLHNGTVSSLLSFAFLTSNLCVANSQSVCMHVFYFVNLVNGYNWMLLVVVTASFECIIYIRYLLAGGLYKGHVDILAPTVQELAALEKEAQTSFLHLGYLPNQLFRTFWLCHTWDKTWVNKCSLLQVQNSFTISSVAMVRKEKKD